MERYNIFHLIHKGLRASLFQTALQLQQADFTDERATGQMLERVREVIMLFEEHAQREDSLIFPAVAPYEPSVVASFETEHQEDERLAMLLYGCMDQLVTAATLLEKLVAGKSLNESFVAFTVYNLQHMAREEDIINKILWRYYSDDEIRLLSSSMSASMEPWIQDFYMTWMIRGVNDQEAAEWMRAIEKNLPELVFRTLLQKAEQEWSQDRYRKITHTLSEGVMVA